MLNEDYLFTFSPDLHLALVKDHVPHLFPALFGMYEHIVLCTVDGMGRDTLFFLSDLDTTDYRPWLWGQ